MLHSWVFEYCTRVVFDITCLRMSRENGVAWPSTILTDNESLHQKSHSDVLKPEVVSCKVQHSSKDRAEKRWVFEGGKSPRRFWWRIHSLSIFSSPKEWVLLILCQMATHAIATTEGLQFIERQAYFWLIQPSNYFRKWFAAQTIRKLQLVFASIFVNFAQLFYSKGPVLLVLPCIGNRLMIIVIIR